MSSDGFRLGRAHRNAHPRSGRYIAPFWVPRLPKPQSRGHIRVRAPASALQSELDDSPFKRDRHRMGAIIRSKLRQDVLHVGLDGLFRNAKLLGHLAV